LLVDVVVRKERVIIDVKFNEAAPMAHPPVQLPVRLAYQPPASSTFLLEQISHQQPASSTFLSQQISTSHQPPTKRTGSSPRRWESSSTTDKTSRSTMFQVLRLGLSLMPMLFVLVTCMSVPYFEDDVVELLQGCCGFVCVSSKPSALGRAGIN
jgi:hypothetical protein